MFYCENCGAGLRPGVLFCKNCGTRLPQDPADAQSSLMGNQNVIAGDVSNTVNTVNNHTTTHIHQDDSRTTVTCAFCGKLLSKGSGQVYLCGDCGNYVCADHIDPVQHKCHACMARAEQHRAQADMEQKLAPFRYQRLGNGKYVIIQLLDMYAMDVTVPAGVESIAAEAFAGSRIIRISLPDGLIAIDDGAFRDCRMLKQINIPASVLYIGNEAFRNCEKLEIALPSTADLGCDVMTGTLTHHMEEQRRAQEEARRQEARRTAEEEARRKAEAERLRQAEEAWKKAEAEAKRKAEETRLRALAEEEQRKKDAHQKMLTDAAAHFDYKGSRLEKFHSSVASYTVPSFITAIGANAFAGCDTLRSLTLPDTLLYIDKGAFAGCTRLESIVIPPRVTTIGAEAFDRCESLTSVSIPKSIRYIEDYAFRNCGNLRTLTLPDSVQEKVDLFSRTPMHYLFTGIFQNCTSLEEVVLPTGIHAVVSSLFEGCTALRSVTVPHTVKDIYENAFAGCTALTAVQMPVNLQEIRTGAFQNCTGLAAIHTGTAKIFNHAFRNCTQLTVHTRMSMAEFKKKNSRYIGGRKLACKDKSCPLNPDSVAAVNGLRKRILFLSVLSFAVLGASVACSLLLGTTADWICGGVFAALCACPLFMKSFGSRYSAYYKLKAPLRILAVAPLLLNIVLLLLFPETYRIAAILPCVGLVVLVVLWIWDTLRKARKYGNVSVYLSDLHAFFRSLLCLSMSMALLVVAAAGISGVLNLLLYAAGVAALTAVLWWMLLRLAPNTNGCYHPGKGLLGTFIVLIALLPIVLCAGLAMFLPAFVPVFLR